MFCEEPVLCAYGGKIESICGADAFFDCYHELTYHTTVGYRIVLETEHFYISLDHNGVELLKKEATIEEIARQGEYLDPYIHTETDPAWVDYESTLFVGERLCSTERKENYLKLKFDDFEMKLVSHDLGEDNFPGLYNKNHWAYNHVLGYETRLKKQCRCGGKGELFLDFVSDYVVRCSKCNKATHAEKNAQDAIEAWNKGEAPCCLEKIDIE